jgi:hypothetical protein
MEHEEALEKAMRSKIERRTTNNILTYLEFYLHDELVGMVDERHRIFDKVKNQCIKEGFIE